MDPLKEFETFPSGVLEEGFTESAVRTGVCTPYGGLAEQMVHFTSGCVQTRGRVSPSEYSVAASL